MENIAIEMLILEKNPQKLFYHIIMLAEKMYSSHSL